MTFKEKKEKLDCLLSLISFECSGSVSALCETLRVSKSTLLRYVDELRQMGYSIGFCQQRNTYYFIHIDEISMIVTSSNEGNSLQHSVFQLLLKKTKQQSMEINLSEH